MLLDSAAFVLCLEFSATPGSCFVSVWLKSIAGLLRLVTLLSKFTEYGR
jgi:hypothetical protein